MRKRQTKSKQRVADHGEVFTDEREVNAMLDLVEPEMVRIASRFLEPACGNGNFLAEILRRKLTVVNSEHGKNTASYERYAVLSVTTLYGVDILPDNVKRCRKRLYDIFNREYSANCKKKTDDETRKAVQDVLRHNVICGNTLKMKKKNGKPIEFVEWSEEEKEKGRFKRRYCQLKHLLEANADELIHTAKPEEILPMKFDVIVGNPPYQLSDGGSGTGISAKPLYHLFVDQAKKLNPHFLCMIIPARWFAGGKGLDEFRDEMLGDRRIRVIVDYPSSKECFDGVNIAGGVCYFLWDRDDSGDCVVKNRYDGDEETLVRELNEFSIFVRDNIAIRVIRKVLARHDDLLTNHNYARNPFGFPSRERGEKNAATDDIKLISSAGVGFVNRNTVKKNADLIDKYKVTIGKVVPSNGEVDATPGDGYKVITSLRILEPGEIHTESYLLLSVFDSAKEAENFAKYMALKLPRFLLKQTLTSMNITKNNFMFVPYLDYRQKWTDAELFDRYGLSDSQREWIESVMRPMDIGGNDGEPRNA